MHIGTQEQRAVPEKKTDAENMTISFDFVSGYTPEICNPSKLGFFKAVSTGN